MAEEPIQATDASAEPDRKALVARVETVGWASFFIWVGISWLTEMNFGIALLGVAAITVGGQVARMAFKLPVEGFWMVVGLCFALGGLWELVDTEIPIAPILLIVAGGALLLNLLRRKRRDG
jgi:hypothetical protein